MKTENFREADQARRQRLAQRYPDSWQDLCREILKLYAKFQTKKPSGKPIGAPTLRNIIMEDEDKDHPQGRDTRLNHDHLSAWMRNKTKKLSEVDFSFVDKFIHSLPLNDEVYRPIKDELLRHASEKLRSSFSKIYSNRRSLSSHNIPEYLRNPNGVTYVCEAFSDWHWTNPVSGRARRMDFSQIALHFGEFNLGMFEVRAIYSKHTFWSLRKNKTIRPEDTIEYFGYAITNFRDNPGDLGGVLHLNKGSATGISDVSPFTISTFSFFENENGELATNWIPQIIVPTVNGFLYDDAPYTIPQLDFHAPQDSRKRKWYASRGMLRFKKINEEYDFLGDYMMNLTDDYLIW